MATFRITAPNGSVYEITAPDDATQEQVLAYAKANYEQANPAPAQPKPQQPAQPQRSGFDNLTRQVGLTARYGLEGLGQAADIVAAPINALTGGTNPSQSASQFSDWLGLPKPEGKLERVVGDATRMGFGAALPAGIAGKLAPMATSTAGKAVATGLADNVPAQIGGGAGAGAADSLARDANLPPAGVVAAGLAGGVAGGMLGQPAMRAASGAGELLVRSLGRESLPKALSPRNMTDAQLATTLRNRISISGGDWDAIPASVQRSVLADVRKAKSLDNLDAKALQRLADFRATGLTPTRGTVTLDPIQITREKNLAKAGANSTLSSPQGLARVENENAELLIKRLQELQGARDVEATEIGRKLSDNIFAQRDALRQAEQAAWEAAKASPGYKMPMDAKVLSDMNQALGDSALMPFMDKNISAYMQALQANPEQFTPQAYQNLQSMLSRAMAAGGNEAAAAGAARKALEAAQIKPQASQIPNPQGLPSTGAQARVFRVTDGMPEDSMAAINQARAATRAAYAFEDSSPLVRKALSEGSMSDPTRLGEYLLRSTPDEAAEIARLLGNEGKGLARAAIATHIKQKALNGASDEMGNVSQKALNSAIKRMGDEKLKLFFLDDEIDQLKRLGRVASYVQAQPAGSAVNNSNSGAMVVGKGLDLLTGISSKIPFLNINQQVDALATTFYRNPQAMNATAGIFAKPEQGAGLLSSAGRGAVAGGLLSSTPLLATAEEPKKRKNSHGK